MSESKTILLVDDSEADRFLMRAAFRTMANCSLPLQAVGDGVEALSYLKGEAPYSDRAKFPLPAVMLLGPEHASNRRLRGLTVGAGPAQAETAGDFHHDSVCPQ